MSTQEKRSCPTRDDIQRYALNNLSEPETSQIKNHVDHCLSCTEKLEYLQDLEELARLDAESDIPPRQVPESLKKLFAQRSANFRQLLQLGLPEKRRFGQIWSTKIWNNDQENDTEESGIPLRLVVLLEDEVQTAAADESFLEAAPISIEYAYRANYDLMVFEQESPLNYPFMIEVWNRVSPLVAQLERYLGTLQQPLKSFLGLIYQAHFGISIDQETAIHQHLGPAILHPDDPRIHFQEQEIEACDYLRRPILELLKRDEKRLLEADCPETVVLFQGKLPVKHGQLPHSQHKVKGPLAAADSHIQVQSYFIHTQVPTGEIVARLNRDFKTGFLRMTWEHLPQNLQGTTVSILLHTTTGEILSVGEFIVRQDDRVLFGQGGILEPVQVESLHLEFRG